MIADSVQRARLATAVYTLVALILAAVGGGWIGLARVDPALIIPGMGWASIAAAAISPTLQCRQLVVRTLVLLLASAVCVWGFAGWVFPWWQWGALVLASVAINAAIMAIVAWWRGKPHTRVAKAMLAVVAITAAITLSITSWRALPYFYDDARDAERLTLSVLSGVPLTADHMTFGASMHGASFRAPVLRRLEVIGSITLIDSISDQLRPGTLLLLIHPRALEPQQLVAIDAFVRGGGRAMILADGLSSWPTAYPAGDARNPAVTSLLTPLLTHWGLTLDAPDGLRAMAVTHTDSGERLRFFSPGRLHADGRACVVSTGGVIARCAIGAGRAIIVADADWLDADHWRGPAGEGAAHDTAGNIDWLIGQLRRLAGDNAGRRAWFHPVWTR